MSQAFAWPLAVLGLPGSSPPGAREAALHWVMTDFLTSLASDQPVLWTALVLGAVGGGAVALYLTWEAVIRAVSSLHRCAAKNRDGKP